MPRGIAPKVAVRKAGGIDNVHKAAALLFFSLPLIAEVLRKYVIPSNLVLAVVDAVAVVAATVLFVRRPSRVAGYIVMAVAVLSAWALLTVLLGHQDMMLGLVGVRAILVPASYLLGAVYFGRRLGIAATSRLLYWAATFWFVLIGAMAGLQLLLGREHWLNYFPAELGGDERMGIGDYTFQGFGLPQLFRPTSIFLHTGKFGMVAFILAAYRLCYATATRQGGLRWIAHRLLDLLVIVLSGQRAALVGFVFVYIALWPAELKRKHALLVRTALTGVVMLVLLWASVRPGWEPSVPQLVASRALSGFTDMVDRIRDNLLQPAGYVVDHFGLRGEGAGAFSLGSAAWGGMPLYNVVLGSAENSWLRVIAEQGIIGMVLQAAFLVGLIWVSWAVYLRGTRSRRAHLGGSWVQVLVICPGLILAVLLLWANTHDVLGNVTVMSLSLSLFGVAFPGMQGPGISRSTAWSRGRSR
ncbi:MAG: hypothetical protein KatS3mg082_3348 [Nitrospiraceae bacterium]|nr:MAG: hypothetical protein KatS3mg082_3348 [Nitrospiraceae bacterium]